MARRPSPPRLDRSPAGNYEIRWTEGGRSRRVSTGTDDQAEAARFFAEWLFRKGKAPEKTPTVGMVLDAYLEDKDRGGQTREGMAAVRVSRLLGRLRVDQLTAQAIGEYGVTRAGEGVKNATVRRELGVLVAAINHAVRQRRMQPGLAPVIDLPADSQPRERVLSSGQLDALLRMTAPAGGERLSRLHRFLWITSETASRRAAVECLCWPQVDLPSGVIRFDRVGVAGKVKRRVAVPISDRLRPILERAHRERVSEFVLDHDGECYQSFKALMARAAKERGEPELAEMTPHDLRRTWATMAARAGVSLWDIAGVLGDTIEVVTRHYAHHQPEHLRSAVNFNR